MTRLPRAPLVIFCLVILLAACSPSRLVEAVHVLEDLEAYDRPSSLKESTPDPVRETVTFGDGEDRQRAHLYLTQEPAGGSIVLVPGVTPHGLRDARVVAFATTLARARFDVLVPDLVHMWAQQIDAADADTIAGWIAFLERRAPGRPVGVIGVSFGAGPAMIALFRPEAAGIVDFALTIGGYHEIDALIAYVTTGGHRAADTEPWTFAPPDPRAKWVFARTNARRITDATDRQLIDAIAQRKLADATADVADLAARLGPEGRSVHALLANTDPAATSRLIDALPPPLTSAIRDLDVAAHELSDHPATFIVLHDIQDQVIPASESVKLARAAGTEARLIGSLDHANVKEPGIRDAITMLRIVYTVLGMRAATAAPPSADGDGVAQTAKSRY